MLRSFLSLLLIASTAAAAPLNLSRTRLCAEPDRDFAYVWTYDGNLAPTWTLGNATVQPWAGSQVETWYDGSYHGGFTLPAGTPPGVYHSINVDGGGGIPLTVASPPNRKQARIAANDDSLKNCRIKLAAGFLELILDPGEHVWPDMLVLPANAILRGYGATVKRAYVTNYGTNWPLVYIGGNDISVYGVTFVHDRQPNQVFIALGNPDQWPTGLVCADCTFKRCNFGFYLTQVYVRDCLFDGAGSTIAPGGFWLRCTFTGLGQHAWQQWGGLGAAAMLDCVFRDTDRGPVFRGDVSDFLCVGLSCSGINRMPNGNEIGLAENGFTRGVYLHTRIVGCESSFLQLDSTASDIFVRDFSMNGGVGLILWGDVQRVTLQDFELRNGAGIYCGENCQGFQAIDGNVIGWLPGRGDQIFQNGSPVFGYARKVACVAVGPNAATNKLTRINVLGTTFTPSQGFKVETLPDGGN